MTFDDLKSRHPRLLRPTQHFEHDVGWVHLLDDYFCAVDRELPAGDSYVVQQIKEKMGSLTIYDQHPPSDVIDRARELACARSFYTCERCGRPGVLRTLHHWHSVRCEEHAVERGEYAPPRVPAVIVRVGSAVPGSWRQYHPDIDDFKDIEDPEWSKPR